MIPCSRGYSLQDGNVPRPIYRVVLTWRRLQENVSDLLWWYPLGTGIPPTAVSLERNERHTERAALYLRIVLLYVPGGSFFCSDRPDDGALTVTSLAHSSLLADLAVTTAKRSQWNKYAAWFGVAGANSIVLRCAQPIACEWLMSLYCSQWIGNGRNLPAFRVLSFILSAVACALFYATAKHLEPLEAQARRSLSATHSEDDLRLDVSTWTLSKQLLHRNFLIYCLIGIIQVFNCHFNSNLLAMVLARVFDSSAFVQTAVLFGSAVLPQLCVALLADTVVSRGLFTVVGGLLLAKTGVALLNSVFGDPSAMMLAALFLLANKVVTEVRASHV